MLLLGRGGAGYAGWEDGHDTARARTEAWAVEGEDKGEGGCCACGGVHGQGVGVWVRGYGVSPRVQSN